MKSLLLVIFATLAVACGAYAGHGGPPPPSSGSPVGFDVTATEKDHAITMHVGQKLEVVLHANQGMKPWTHPTSSNTSVLEPIVDVRATAVRGVTLAAFQANAPGQVEITANAAPDCAPDQACAMYLAVYNLWVTVTD
jgi:hypothetical protein